MEAKGQSGAAPAAAPLLSSQYSDLYGVFRISLPPPCEITNVGVCIVGFRSRGFYRIQGCVK
jgi:hypothetical protein